MTIYSGIVKEECDANGKTTYREWSNGYWMRYTYNEQGLEIKWEDSEGRWQNQRHNANGRVVSLVDSDGNCDEWEYRNGKIVSAAYHRAEFN